MDPELAEQPIARGLHDGQADAWLALYDAYAQRVWRLVARQMGPDATEVADVVQETFMAAARSARQYDPARGSLWMWLCGIARRHVALHYRKRQQRERLTERTRELTTADRPTTRWPEGRGLEPEELLAQRELAGQVRLALTELSVDYETLLTARYLDGVSVDELAGQEDCTVVAIRAKLARARRAFRKAFRRSATS